MRVFSLLVTVGALTQGILAQQEFLAKLPPCAVSSDTPVVHLKLTTCSRNAFSQLFPCRTARPATSRVYVLTPSS
jgi:hypothetical protein